LLRILRFSAITVMVLLLVVIGGLWAVSYKRFAYANYRYSDQSGWYVLSDAGAVYVAKFDPPPPGYEGPRGDITVEGLQGLKIERWRPLRMLGSPLPSLGPAHRYHIVPHWIFLVPAAPLLIRMAACQRRRTVRVKAGLCRHCGYDMRATPDRCPECGSAATSHLYRGAQALLLS